MRRFKAYDTGGREQRRMRDLCLRYIDSAIDDPAVRAAVTPSYPWGCKRPIFASGFYPALNRPNVDLVPHAVTKVTEKGVVDDQGIEHPIDVLILSTGFQPTRFLSGFTVDRPRGQGASRSSGASAPAPSSA